MSKITDPVPRERRHLSAVDVGVLWSTMGVSLLSLVAGAGLVAYGASVPVAIAVTVVGGCIGALMLAAAGALGAKDALPGMVILRRSLGERGSWVPTALNIAQGLGWGLFEVLVIAETAYLLIGWGDRAWYVVAAAALGTALAVLGPDQVVRRILRRVMAPLVAVSVVYLLIHLLMERDAGLSVAGDGDLPFMIGLDIVIATFASWLPMVPDYTRFAQSPRAGALGTSIGYFVGNTITFTVGILLAAQIGVIGSATDGVSLMIALPLGVLAAAILVLDESEKAFANIYSTAVSVCNLRPSLSPRVVAAIVGGVVGAGALTISLDRFFDFLFLLGAVFVPLFGAVFADRWQDVSRPRATVIAWVAGFLAYQALNPTSVLGIADHVPWSLSVGATLPAFAVAAAVRLLWKSHD